MSSVALCCFLDRYHLQGRESWTLKSQTFSRLCEFDGLTRNPTDDPTDVSLSRHAVMEYCRSIHLCEPCCRIAHQTKDRQLFNHSSSVSTPVVNGELSSDVSMHYRRRSVDEYATLCQTLGHAAPNSSLQSLLRLSTPEEGLLIEVR